ncbi:MAG TPA: aminotransferase class IV [Candidatus Deferrimicrobium sp.]|nr:aminotransferase class IV [Candidatus Deferrimicrobium sp.]
MKVVTTINGRFVRRGQDKISVFDNALLYADGLFETLLAIEGRVLFMREHLQRLRRGAAVIGLRIPVSLACLSEWMVKTVRAHPDRVTKLRLTMTSGESARWVGQRGTPQIILSASPHRVPEQPFKLWVSPFRIDQDSEFRRIKTLSCAIHAAALKQAHAHRCDDALLLNEKGHVAEVSSANVFWAKRRKVYTPPLSAGCLEGVTRAAVLRQAAKLDLSVAEQNATLGRLLNADEIFISSSLKLVVAVGVIKSDDTTQAFETGPLTQQISRRFRHLVGIADL